MVPEVGIAPTSPPLQGGANLPQLLGEMVVPRGNAPRSSAYQADALLLSYRTENGSRGARGGHPSRYEFHPATPAAGLHAPINAKPRFSVIVLPERWRAFRLRQHRKDLSLLLGNGLGLLWSSFLPAVQQPLRYILDYGHVGLLGLRVKVADGVGIVPTQSGGSLGFRDRGITALPTIRNGQGGRSCTCDLLVPNEAVCC